MHKAHTSSLAQAVGVCIRREFLLLVRRPSDLLNPLLFFALVSLLFPLGISPTEAVLQPVASGVVWVAALLATLLSLDSLFRQDLLDGSLEQLLLTPHPLSVLVMAKVGVHWLMTAIPLILMAPVLGAMLYLPAQAQGVLMLALLLGTPVLILVGAIGAALTVSLRKTGVLLTLMVLPLYIPVLIFGTSAVHAAAQDLPADGQLAFLGAILSLALVLAPLGISAALKVSVRQ